MSDTRETIVVTGIGLACGLGLDPDTTWQNVLAGKSGLRPLTAMESTLPTTPDGGQALDLPADFAPNLPREARYLKWTIGQALHVAGIDRNNPYDPTRCGLMLGTTLHGIRAAGRYLRSGDYSDLKEFLAADVLRIAAGDFNLRGQSATGCSACSSSLGSIALSVTLLQTGQLDLVVTGGYDTISEYVFGGFNSLRLVAPGPLRPFARDRQGMKLAEGYGIVILERKSDALKRGAKIVAEIAGFGESADAHHLTQPHPQGEGATRAMAAAIKQANLEANQIDLVAAHATGTPDNDAAEFAAMLRVFGEHMPSLPVVAYKSHLGHTLGGAGAVELILSMLALRDQTVPPCANSRAEDIEFPGLNLSLGEPKKAKITYTLNTSLGFGGANTCMVLSSPSPRRGEGRGEGGDAEQQSAMESRTTSKHSPLTPTLSPRGEREILITGVGVVLTGAIGNEAFINLLKSGEAPACTKQNISDDEIAHLINARRVRRMSDYVKLSLAATMVAMKDAGISDTQSFAAEASAILGSTHGSTNYSEQYYAQIVREGVLGANPMLFAEGVPNAGAAHLSMMLGVRGACQTIIGSRTAGLDALRLAAARIASGQWDRAVVSAAEEYSDVVCSAYRHAGLARSDGQTSGFVCSPGAVTIILENQKSVEARQGKIRGRILAAAAASGRPARIRRTVRDVLDRLPQTDRIIGSSNHTWLDRAEEIPVDARYAVEYASLHDRIGETFSVGPLAASASILLANDSNDGQPVTVLVTDYTGLVAGVVVQL